MFLATCFKYLSRGLPTAFSLNIAPSRTFTTNSLCLTVCPIHEWRLTYLLTPWCRVLLEKLTGLQLVKKFPAFYGTRRFITALTSVRHLSLSCASPIQSTYPHLLEIHPNIIHPSLRILRDVSPRNTPPPEIRVGE